MPGALVGGGGKSGSKDVAANVKESWELSDMGLAFRKEFDDVVLLEQWHRLVKPEEENIPEGM